MLFLSDSAIKSAFSLCEMFSLILMLLNAVLIFLFNIKKNKALNDHEAILNLGVLKYKCFAFCNIDHRSFNPRKSFN